MIQAVSHEKQDDPPTDHLAFLDSIQTTLHFIEALKHKVFVVKIGGSTLQYQQAVLQDSIWLHALGVKVILVHGGGPSITAWLEKLQIPTHFEQGLRVTDAQTLEVVRMVLCGQINADGTHLSEINKEQALSFIEDGTIYGGMILKITACIDALADVSRVHIADGSMPHVLLYELEDHPHLGTTFTR